MKFCLWYSPEAHSALGALHPLYRFNDALIEAVFSNRGQALAPARTTVIESAVARVANKANTGCPSSECNQVSSEASSLTA